MKDYLEYLKMHPFLNIIQFACWTLVGLLIPVNMIRGHYLSVVYNLIMFGFWVWLHVDGFMSWQKRKRRTEASIKRWEEYIERCRQRERE